MINILSHSPDPLSGVKGKLFKFLNNSVSCQYFLLKFRIQTKVQYYEKYQTISDQRPGLCPLNRLRGWIKRSTFNFFRTWSFCISNKMESQVHQHDIKYFAHIPPPPDTGDGVKGHNSIFQNMVMLHIILIMLQHGSKYFALRPPPTRHWGGVKRSNSSFFRTLT